MSYSALETVYQDDRWRAVTSKKHKDVMRWSKHTGWCTKKKNDAKQYCQGGKLIAIYRVPNKKSRPSFQLFCKEGKWEEFKHRDMFGLEISTALMLWPKGLRDALQAVRESTKVDLPASFGEVNYVSLHSPGGELLGMRGYENFAQSGVYSAARHAQVMRREHERRMTASARRAEILGRYGQEEIRMPSYEMSSAELLVLDEPPRTDDDSPQPTAAIELPEGETTIYRHNDRDCYFLRLRVTPNQPWLNLRVGVAATFMLSEGAFFTGRLESINNQLRPEMLREYKFEVTDSSLSRATLRGLSNSVSPVQHHLTDPLSSRQS